MLEEQGWKKIVVLGFPASILPHTFSLPNGIERVIFEDLSLSHLEKTLALIQKKYGPAGLFIHLHPEFRDDLQRGNFFNDNEKVILKQVFFIAKYLKKPLNKAAQSHRSSFLIITRLNGQLGFGIPVISDSIAGGLYGLVKTLNVEWPDVFCRAIDIHPDFGPQETVERIKTEIFDPDSGLVEVGYTKSDRLTLTTEISVDTAVSSNEKTVLKTDNVFLVAGGGKGITAACITELAQRQSATFILLGRTELMIEEPDWIRDCFEDTELKKRCMNVLVAEGEKPTPVKIMNRLKPILATREINATINALSNTNSKVEYVSVDINNEKQVRQALEPIIKKHGGITGLIHSAGVLADKLIEDKTENDFEAVYTTKIQGLKSLLNCVKLDQLKHLVLFSSAAGFFGNEAQSDYAAANDILNKFAHLFNHQFPKCHVVSFNWGPWDGGMVTPELKRLFGERNIKIIPIDVGANIMADEIEHKNKDIVQIVVGSSMIIPKEPGQELKSYRLSRTLELNNNTFLFDHTIGEEPVLPIICAISWMADSCQQLYPGYHFHTCQSANVLKGIVFNQSAAKNYILDINETGKSENGDMTFQVKISSLNASGKPFYHYSATIGLAKSTPEKQFFSDFNLTEKDVLNGDDLYTNGTLFHGPVFQIVKRRINISNSQMTLECQASKPDENKMGQFPVSKFNQYAGDSLLQSLLIWNRHFYDAGSLPLKLEKGEFIRQIPFEKSFYISLKVKKTNQSQLVADIIAHDAEGNIYSRLFNAEATLNKNLNEKFIK